MEKMNFSLKRILVLVSFLFIVCFTDQSSADEKKNATHRVECDLNYSGINCIDEQQNTFIKLSEIPDTMNVLILRYNDWEDYHIPTVKNLMNITELEVIEKNHGSIMFRQDFLQTMQNLESLTISIHWFHKNDLSKITLRLPKLKTLRFTSYSSRSLPYDFYCSFPGLKRLIIGYRILSDILHLPCGLNSSCCSHLRWIDIGSELDYIYGRVALEAFFNLPSLEVLLIHSKKIIFPSNLTATDFNNLTDLQLFINCRDMDFLIQLRSLTHLWVPGSISDEIESLDFEFHNLAQLTALDLRNFRIERISSNSFKNCFNLTLLNLSANNISSLTNSDNSGNFTNVFTSDGIPRLEYLLLAFNQIQHLDYSMIPETVKVLDVSHNPLSSLSDNEKSCGNHALKELHANSCPLLRNLEHVCFPPPLEVISLKLSMISSLSPNTFSSLNNLKELLLVGNNFLKVDPSALSLNNGNRFPVNIYVESACSSKSVRKRLQNVCMQPLLNYQSDHRCQYFKICYKTGELHRGAIITDCNYLMLNVFPLTLVKDSKEIYFEGNNLTTVDLDIILTRYLHLNVLYLNQSNIRQIEIKYVHIHLTKMHLEDNSLQFLPKYFFVNLEVLHYLYLERNSFKQFKILVHKWLSLEELHLENNSISEFLVYNSENEFEIPYSIRTVYLQFNEISKINASFCDYRISTLHLENNKITHLDFACINGPRLGYLYLQNNHLTVLNSSAFNNLPNLRELNLEGNRIRQIKNKAFSHLEILKRLNLGRNKIEEMDEGMFYEVNNLQVLNLDENFLVEIPPLIFNELQRLQKLYLNRNKITKLSLGLFKNNEELKELHLEENFIQRIDLSLLQQLSLDSMYLNNNNISEIISHPSARLLSLEKLHLQGNRTIPITKLFLHHNEIHHLDKDTFRNLTSLEILTLHENKLKQPEIWNFGLSLKMKNLTIHQNPLVCDCKFLKKLRSFLRNNHYISNVSEIKCFSTTNEEISIDRLDDFLFRLCQSNSSAKIITGLSLSIGFLLFIGFISLLLFKYRLAIQVILYSRFKIRFCYDAAMDEGKQYHAFVAYSYDDRAFVANELVPRLEDYRICIHDRDFVVGLFIQENIINAVQNSCCTLMIFSNSFVKSEWCRYEFRTAYEKTRKDRWRRILVILMEDVNPDDLEDEMQFYLSTTTYLRREDPLFWDKLYFALPPLTASERERNRPPQDIPLEQLNR